MPAIFTYHRITAEPRQWRTLATSLAQHSGARLAEQGGRLYGLWRSQIGRPRDELQAMTVWSGAIRAREAERLLLGVEPEVRSVASEMLLSTLRPADAKLAGLYETSCMACHAAPGTGAASGV